MSKPGTRINGVRLHKILISVLVLTRLSTWRRLEGREYPGYVKLEKKKQGRHTLYQRSGVDITICMCTTTLPDSLSDNGGQLKTKLKNDLFFSFKFSFGEFFSSILDS